MYRISRATLDCYTANRAKRWAQPFTKRHFLQATRAMWPIIATLTFAGVAHAQGTMDFSGAQTLMGTFKTHIALALGLAACQRGHRVRFTTTAALVSELIEARDEKKLLRFQKQIASYELLIVDELGFVPLSKTGAELLFEMLSQRYERGSTLVTSNLPFQEWTEILGSERLTGALLDRLTHHVNILEMNGDSYRLKQSRRKRNPSAER